MKINKFPGNTVLFKIKYFHCAEEQKANGDDKVKECSDISFQACQLQHFILHKILNRGKIRSHELFKQENEFTVNLWSWKQGVLKITGLLWSSKNLLLLVSLGSFILEMGEGRAVNAHCLMPSWGMEIMLIIMSLREDIRSLCVPGHGTAPCQCLEHSWVIKALRLDALSGKIYFEL